MCACKPWNPEIELQMAESARRRSKTVSWILQTVKSPWNRVIEETRSWGYKVADVRDIEKRMATIYKNHREQEAKTLGRWAGEERDKKMK